MLHKLQSSDLQISVSETGAELTSILKGGIEYMWQCTSAYWMRSSPVLFPFVGKLRYSKYTIGDDEYVINASGFARTMKFEFIESRNSLLFMTNVYRSDFPFDADLQIEYKINGNRVSISWRVMARNDIYFSIGAHPAFNCPLLKDESFEDYCLVFEKQEPLLSQKLNKELLLTGDTIPVATASGVLPLNYHLFDNDTLIFSKIKSNFVTLMSGTKKVLTLHFENFPHIAISSPKAPFICIQPWLGLPDLFDATPEIEAKPDMIFISNGQTFCSKYEIEIH